MYGLLILILSNKEKLVLRSGFWKKGWLNWDIKFDDCIKEEII